MVKYSRFLVWVLILVRKHACVSCAPDERRSRPAVTRGGLIPAGDLFSQEILGVNRVVKRNRLSYDARKNRSAHLMRCKEGGITGFSFGSQR
jgi:hypothetical protein